MWEHEGGYRVESLAIALTLLFDAVVLIDAMVFGLPLLRPAVGFVFLTFVVGGVSLAALDFEIRFRPRSLVYVVGTSLVLVMLTGFLLNLGLPYAGIDRPIAPGPLVAGLSILTIGVGALGLWLRPGSDGEGWRPDRRTLELVRRDGWQIGLLVALPIASILAVTYLNVSNASGPLLVLLASIAAVPLLVVLGAVRERYLALAVGAMSLAMLYHKSFWVGKVYGGHVSVVGVYERGIWTLTGEELLPNAILMPTYAHVTGVDIITQMKVIMPAMVVVIPVALFVTFRRYTSPSLAFLGAALFVFAHPFYFQYPSTPRASMPVLFLVSIGTVMSDDETGPLLKRVLAVVFASGLAVSHYGTSYYVLFALVGALVAILHFEVVDRLVEWGVSRRPSPDGGSIRGSLSRLVSRNTIRPDYVAFYVAVVAAWYYYIDRSSRFVSVAQRIVASYESLMTPGGQGVTATRLTTDYGTLSIDYSKYLYMVVAALVGMGLAITVLRRYVPRWRTEFSDEFVSVSAMLFALFGATFILSGQWGGGRPMMIVLSFNAIFVGVAVVALGRGLAAGCERIARRQSRRLAEAVERAPTRLAGQAALATLLAVFLLLNSGFMAAVAYGGQAPSNVPQTDVDSIHHAYNIDTLAWLADHRDDDYQVWGDRLARQQTTDWMNGEIAAVSERQPVRFRSSKDFGALDDPSLERGYVLFMAHNVEERRVSVNYVRSEPLAAYDLGTERRSVVYSNGAGRVYFVGNETQEFMQRGATGS